MNRNKRSAKCYAQRGNRFHGFTLIEVMIALTVTLLMMGALAQSFSYLGNRIQAGRAEVELSGRARSVSVRLRDELRRMTAPVQPPQDAQVGAGYFMYYEGPMSDASTTLHGTDPVTANENSFQDSKWGDIDDYIAFTAKAPAGSWFTGKVPRFVVDPTNAGGAANYDPFEPWEITSEYAEIVYWVSPEWSRTPTALLPESHPQNINTDPTTGLPLYVDNDLNNLPDRLVLRRRVLLIRPDLNLPNGQLPVPQSTTAFPISDAQDNFWFWTRRTPAPIQTHPYASTPLSVPSIFSSNWMVGMQLAYQLCDLSIGRAISPANGTPITPPSSYQAINFNTNIYPTTGIKANTLTDVAQPHNRFAHVRIPGEYFGLTSSGTVPARTTMPVLALTGSEVFLTENFTIPDNFPVTTFDSAVTGTRASPAAFANTAPLFNGFIIPQFELSNYAAHESILNDPRWDRTGEDHVVSDVLAFDIQAFDSNAPLFLHNGPDGTAGTGTFASQGSAGTDDVIVTPDDLGFHSVLTSAAINPAPGDPAGSNPELNPTLADRGAFVDLGYAFRRGSPTRDFWTTAANATQISRVNNYLVSPLSGVNGPPGANRAQATSSSLRKSGRALFLGVTTPIFLQPAYDTYTDAYESDGLNQEANTAVISGTPYGGTWWMLSTVNADEAINGLDEPGSGAGVDDGSERETSAPFLVNLKGIRIRIRLDDVASRQFKQIVVVHDLQQ